MPMKFVFLAAALPLLVGALAEFPVGEPFPDLRLPALDGGDPLSIADFRGEKVVLHVFASW